MKFLLRSALRKPRSGKTISAHSQSDGETALGSVLKPLVGDAAE